MATINLPEVPPGFYVYAVTVDAVVRYVGKGCGERFKEHFRTARRIARIRRNGGTFRTTKFYNRMIRMLGQDGTVIAVEFIAVGLDEHQALDLERREIEARNGLWNVFPGGVGFTSEWIKKRWQDPAYRRQAALRSRTNWEDQEYRDNQMTQRTSPEHKAHMSRMLKTALSNPSVRRKMSDRKKELFSTEEARDALRERGQRLAADPNWIQSLSVALKRKWSDPEYRAKMSVIRKNQVTDEWRAQHGALVSSQQTPERRKQTSDHLKALWRDPVFKAEQLARRRSAKA